MKLVDLLAMYLPEWPTNQKYPIAQNCIGGLYVPEKSDAKRTIDLGIRVKIASDMWQAVCRNRKPLLACRAFPPCRPKGVC